jgi:hypothetical protein
VGAVRLSFWVLLCLSPWILPGCTHTVAPLPADSRYPGNATHARAGSLRATVEAVAAAGSNRSRFDAIRRRADALGLAEYSRIETIDWFGFQKNLVIELPGATDRIVYIVAHYDKADANPLKVLSLLLNGILDDLIAFTFLSDGAADNATGVAVALEIASTLKGLDPPYTTRVLLAGSEESGLRGSRAHVARLSPEEKKEIALAINIDTVGLASSPNCVTQDASDAALIDDVLAAAKRLEVPLDEDALPLFAETDYAPFKETSFWRDASLGLKYNLVGGLLPQRSWFTGRHSAPAINFSGCDLVSIWDYVAGAVFLPVGSLHGPRDHAGRISLDRLTEQYAIILEFLKAFGKNR